MLHRCRVHGERWCLVSWWMWFSSEQWSFATSVQQTKSVLSKQTFGCVCRASGSQTAHVDGCFPFPLGLQTCPLSRRAASTPFTFSVGQ
uniref:Putative secreted protein n=1 Tax=Ixodes scapularis TaxID=6945 RepID=A0A4D5S0K6_IXOSC